MVKVKKVINDPENIVTELVDGLVLAAHGSLRRLDDLNVVARTGLEEGKVGLLIGGGSGHEPMFAGFVGEGLADVGVCGNIFASPPPPAILAAAKAVDRGQGVLYLYGNYAGDVMNFDIAAELAGEEGIRVSTIRVADDVATPDHASRRGIAGAFYLIKIAGASCAEGRSLEQVVEVTAKAQAGLRSIGVAVRPGSLPETGAPTFELGDDEIEIGLGVHGEAGVERTELMPADPLAARLIGHLLDDLPFRAGDRVAMLLNNLGASTQLELLIVNRKIRAILAGIGIDVVRTDLGAYFTSQEMAGFSVTLLRLDDELERLLAAPCRSLALSQH